MPATLLPAFPTIHGASYLACAIYLAPSLALAGVIRYLAARHPIFFVFTLAGTLCHELAHFGVGLLTAAQPRSLSIVPRRDGAGWQLGAVTLARLRWYNAAPTALAPFLLLALPLLAAAWRTGPGWSWLSFAWLDLALAFLIAPQWLSCWPSAADWKIAMRSWPLAMLAVLACCLFVQFTPARVHALLPWAAAHSHPLMRA